eukprot:scaffold236056_cov15-Prasinocladus_malaysianus.AAC.1
MAGREGVLQRQGGRALVCHTACSAAHAIIIGGGVQDVNSFSFFASSNLPLWDEDRKASSALLVKPV